MNRLTALSCPCNTGPLIYSGPDLTRYEPYFHDESRAAGTADFLVFPKNTAETAAAVRFAGERKLSVTVAGARTGITAGAVPRGGLLLCLERMNRIRGLRLTPAGELWVQCEAGVPLADLQRALRTGHFTDAALWPKAAQETLDLVKKKAWFYPPDPTETSASLGGTVACNASGAHTFRYGPTRDYVRRLTIVLADGSRLELERGACRAAADGAFELQQADGQVLRGAVPTYALPKTKNAAGYFAGPGMDLIDLFIGSEGTLGIITDMELRLLPAPEIRCAAVIFWPEPTGACPFTLRARACKESLGLEAIEYFDRRSLDLLRERRRQLGAASGIPECLPANAAEAIYLDLGGSRAALPGALEALAGLIRETGGRLDWTWTALEKAERERLRLFRHALPETVNERISAIRRQYPEITKLGTDMAVPDACLEHILGFYHSRLAERRLDYVIFGHIGDNHLHVNILPRTPAEFAAGKDLYREFAREVVRLGGSPSAEHGIGKLKKEYLHLLFGDAGVAQMQAVKAVFDPAGRLARETLF